MRELHIVMRAVLEDGTHEQIDILDVGIVAINESFLTIYSNDENVVSQVIGQFMLTEIIGYWIEE